MLKITVLWCETKYDRRCQLWVNVPQNNLSDDYNAVVFSWCVVFWCFINIPSCLCFVYIVKVSALHEREVGCDVDIDSHTLIQSELFSLKLILFWMTSKEDVAAHTVCHAHTFYSFAPDKKSVISQWLLSWRAFWGENPVEVEDWLYEMWRSGCVTFKDYT